MRITAKDFQKFVDDSGLKDKFLEFVEQSKAKHVKLSQKVIKKIAYELDRNGQVTLSRTNSGRVELVGFKYVTVAPRRPFDEPLNVKRALESKHLKEQTVA